jgi:hypothetical protein
MEDALRVALNQAKERAKHGTYREVVFCHVLVPVLLEWLDDRPEPEANDRQLTEVGVLAGMASVPPRRPSKRVRRAEDMTVGLDVADRLMIAIGSHISRLNGGIVTTLEASVYAGGQRQQMQAWWEGEGRRWPAAGKEWRKQMTHIRRAYHEARDPYRRSTNAYAESW